MYQTIYHVSFTWMSSRLGALTEWTTPENKVLEGMGDVFEVIGEHNEANANRIRVIQIDLHEGSSREITEDALRDFGDHMVSITGEWPEWLAEFAPDDTKAELARRAAREEAASYGVSEYLEAAE